MQYHSDSLDKLGAALAAAQALIEGAKKDQTGQVGTVKRKYADLASVWDACKPALTSNGLSVIQTGEIVDGRDYLRTTLLHASGQWFAGLTPLLVGEPRGISLMQALGSAQTYARRYGLSAITGVCPEDDDGASAGETPRKARVEPARRDPPPANGSTAAPAQATAPVTATAQLLTDLAKTGKLLADDKLIPDAESFREAVLTAAKVGPIDRASDKAILHVREVASKRCRAAYMDVLGRECERTGHGHEEIHRWAGKPNEINLTIADLRKALKTARSLADAEPAPA